jgi:hypothetical protein
MKRILRSDCLLPSFPEFEVMITQDKRDLRSSRCTIAEFLMLKIVEKVANNS